MRAQRKSPWGINVGGYSVHAATAIKAQERDRLEKLVRYMARPAIADERRQLLQRAEPEFSGT